jgi:phosphohistidine phosphatase SixA
MKFLDLVDENAAGLASILDIGHNPEIWEALGELVGSRTAHIRAEERKV